MYAPPSRCNSCPSKKLAKGELKNTIVFAMSNGTPGLCNDDDAIDFSINTGRRDGSMRRNIRVPSTTPGL